MEDEEEDEDGMSEDGGDSDLDSEEGEGMDEGAQQPTRERWLSVIV